MRHLNAFLAYPQVQQVPYQKQLQPGTSGLPGPKSDLTPMGYYKVNNSFDQVEVVCMAQVQVSDHEQLQPVTGGLDGTESNFYRTFTGQQQL